MTMDSALPEDACLKLYSRFEHLHTMLVARGFSGSPDRWLSVHDLLLRLHQQNRAPQTTKALCILLAPLFCSKQEDQQTFYDVFALWVKQKSLQEQSIARLPDGVKSAPTKTKPFYVSNKFWLIVAGIIVAAAITVVAYLPRILAVESTAQHPPPDTQTDRPKSLEPGDKAPQRPEDLPPIQPIPPQASPTAISLTQPYQRVLHWSYWLALFLPTTLALLTLLAGWARAQFALQSQRGRLQNPLIYMQLQPNRSLPFGLSNFSARFHRSRQSHTRQLNVDHTVQRSIRAGGLLQPVFRTRATPPEYLVLVDKPSDSDPLSALADTLVQRMRSENLHVSHFYFRGDPRWCYRQDGPQTQAQSLGLLQRQHPNARLLIIGDAQQLYNRLNHKMVDWVAEFSPWRLRVWLTNRPQPWGYRESQLAHAGFVVSELDSQALAAVGSWLQSMNQQPEDAPTAPLWIASVNESVYPPLLQRDDDWLNRPKLEGHAARQRLRDLVQQLTIYLNESGMQLLTACAAYPELHGRLTIALDQQLFPSATPQQREQRLLRLSNLPWFQRRFLPVPLRSELLQRIPRSEFESISLIYDTLLQTSSAHPDAWGLQFSNTKEADKKNSKSKRDPLTQTQDALFLKVLRGFRSRLDFVLPEFIAQAVRRVSAPLPFHIKLAVPVLACVVLVLVGWTGYLEPSLRAWQTQRMLTEHSHTGIIISANDLTRPLALRLSAHLQTWGFQTRIDSASKILGQENTIYFNSLSPHVVEVIKQRLADISYGKLVPPWTSETSDSANLQWPAQPDLKDANAAMQLAENKRPAEQQSVPSNVVRISLGETLKGPFVLRDALTRTFDKTVWLDQAARLLKAGEPQEAPAKVDPAKDLLARAIHQDDLESGDLGPKMVIIPAGKFLMGSPPEEPRRIEDEGPQHPVNLTKFALGQTEVTFDDYDRFAKATGRDLPKDKGWGRGQQPVINVSWDDASDYAKWLSEQTGFDYHLPSEAQWEYAARAGTTTAFSTGQCINAKQANFDDSSFENTIGGNYNNCPSTDTYLIKTVPVASYSASDFGLYDMHGNVGEWTADCWHGTYKGAPEDGSAWQADCESTARVVRGGSWSFVPQSLRSAFRGGGSVNGGSSNLGFRLARTLQ